MLKNIQILDCTLRDGGLGLEDLAKTEPAECGFSTQSRDEIRDCLVKSKLDIVELGSIERTSDDRKRFCIYQTIDEISAQMPKRQTKEQMFAALYRGPDVELSEIPDWAPERCEAVRVILRYSELQKSLDFCAGLAKKGYKVFVQPMLTMRYTEKEIDHLIAASNEMNAYALYFVDSYGYMQKSDVDRFFTRYDHGLNPEIRIGFHSHNNMNLAYANAMAFLDRESERSVILDSCAIGMGQGAGNLQTELIAPYLAQRFEKEYDFSAILDACDAVEPYSPIGKWGYSVTRFLPALHHTAYKYSLALRNQYGMRFAQIDRLLSQMPEDLRQRYTPENTKELLRRLGA